MQVDRDYIGKLLNAQVSAMFATWREAKMPEEGLDAIINQNKAGLEAAVDYLKSLDMPDSDRALRANIISWTIVTIGLALELGMKLELNEVDEGQLPPLAKEA